MITTLTRGERNNRILENKKRENWCVMHKIPTIEQNTQIKRTEKKGGLRQANT